MQSSIIDKSDWIKLRVKGLTKIMLPPEIYTKIPNVDIAMKTNCIEAKKRVYIYHVS